MLLQTPPESEGATRLFQEDIASRGHVMNLSRAWAWRPDVADSFLALRTLLTSNSSLTARERSVLVCSAASSRGDSYCSLAWGKMLAAAADAMPDGGAADQDLQPLPASEAFEPEVLDFDAPLVDSGRLVTTEFEAASAADTPRDELLEPTAMEFEAPSLEAGTLEGLEATTFEPPAAGEADAFERVGDEALMDGIDTSASRLEGLESAEFDASGYGGSGLEPIAAPLYDPRHEHDACGVGFVADPHGRQAAGRRQADELVVLRRAVGGLVVALGHLGQQGRRQRLVTGVAGGTGTSGGRHRCADRAHHA